jgi:hypothetical protein
MLIALLISILKVLVTAAVCISSSLTLGLRPYLNIFISAVLFYLVNIATY